ncbi:interferon-induced protein 44-like [Ruditapes philippinarum]|uniref:interferon-induced protein 44-like n=1 Tax=Ruditapes philippinarum TaxID=129788 RepID=UPI00295B1A67|nr:interferon-induced protein 44-like [Ruditapes philippinarum]
MGKVFSSESESEHDSHSPVQSYEPPAPPPAPPCPFTSTPWRTTPAWSEDSESSLRKQIEKIHPKWNRENVEETNPEKKQKRKKPTIVLVGPVGAGKSSFVNAILSVSKGHKVDRALTERGSKSCTTTYDKYTDKSLLDRFRLRDCMGLEQSEEEGFNVADMVALLEGHVKDGYTFNPRSPISPEHNKWRANPEFEHQTHCVVFVVDANVMHIGIPPAYVRKIREIQDAVKRLRVPRVLILTKADVLCKEVHNDIANMFRSVKVREAVKTASEVFNIPEASIHPVTNYEDEDSIEISWKRNIPLLLALRQITQYANDMIEAVNEHSDSD